MRIDKNALEVCLARNCHSISSLRGTVSPQTITRINHGEDVTPRTLGKIARALGVDVEELIAKED